MSAPTSPTPTSARLIRIGGSGEYALAQLALSALVVVAPVAFFACAVLAGGGLSWWWLLVAPLGLLLARWSESSGHLILWSLLLLAWLGGVPGPFTWWSVPAALVVAASHTALSLLGGRPTAGDLATDTWPRVRTRLTVVGGIVVAVAVLAQLVRSLHASGSAVVAVGALLAVAAWVWWGGRRADAAESAES